MKRRRTETEEQRYIRKMRFLCDEQADVGHCMAMKNDYCRNNTHCSCCPSASVYIENDILKQRLAAQEVKIKYLKERKLHYRSLLDAAEEEKEDLEYEKEGLRDDHRLEMDDAKYRHKQKRQLLLSNFKTVKNDFRKEMKEQNNRIECLEAVLCFYEMSKPKFFSKPPTTYMTIILEIVWRNYLWDHPYRYRCLGILPFIRGVRMIIPVIDYELQMYLQQLMTRSSDTSAFNILKEKLIKD